MELNGKEVQLGEERSLSTFLTQRQYDLRTIAVELNGVIVPKSKYDSIRLTDKDTVEVVRFVGGG